MPRDQARPTRARGRARREQLLRLAAQGFAERGYRGLSLADVAAQAGISQTGLLHHFPTKQHLLLETLDVYASRALTDAHRTSGDSSTTFAQRLLRIAAQHERDPSIIRLFAVLATESVAADHPAHAWFATRYVQIRATIERELAADQGAGLMPAEHDPRMVARVLLSALNGLQLQLVLSDGKQPIVAPLEALLRSLYATK
jgi:AcrR family transcriptional regulator